MLLDIVEGREDLFVEKFPSFKAILPEFYKKRYFDVSFYATYTMSFMENFLNAAIKNNRRKVIDLVLSYESFDVAEISFPETIEVDSTYNYVALKMLENGGRIAAAADKGIPPTWITPKVMNDFLDSRISYSRHELIEIDCSFMQHSITKKKKVECEDDVDLKLMLWEDVDAIELITTNTNLQSVISHPVMATYIDLKTHKYQRIFFWNFIFFALLFVLPFIAVVIKHFCLKECESNTVSSLYWIWLIGIIIFTACTIIGFVMIKDKSWKRNLWEITLTVFSVILWIIFWFKECKIVHYWLGYLFGVFAIILAIEFLYLLPFSRIQPYTIITKKVAMTFLKMFLFFGSMLLLFLCCFCVIFRNREGEFLVNFLSFWKSLFKLTLMLSGDDEIKNVELNTSEMIFVAFFVGYTVDDVKKIKENATTEVLKEKSKTIIQIGKLFYRIYTDFG
jgi:hypothetical protein